MLDQDLGLEPVAGVVVMCGDFFTFKWWISMRQIRSVWSFRPVRDGGSSKN